MTPTEIKSECERIWQFDGIAHHHNITGWHLTEYAKREGLGYYVGKIFTHFKGRRVKLLKRKPKC